MKRSAVVLSLLLVFAATVPTQTQAITPPSYDISGYKYDADSVVGLGGWTMTLFQLVNGVWQEVAQDVTDDFGSVGLYSFYDLGVGHYKVVETLQPGWGAVNPVTGEHEFDLQLGGQHPNLDFYNAQLYEICGYKYNGFTNNPMLGLKEWTINLYQADDAGNYPGYPDTPTDATQTDENGNYCFTDLRAGKYMVTETLKLGWIQTSPAGNVYYVDLPEDDTTFVSYDFVNEPKKYCFDETVWAAQKNPSETRFVVKGDWATYVVYNLDDGSKESPKVYPLYAGQYHPAGTLEVYDDGTYIYFKYSASNDDKIGYLPDYCGVWNGLTEFHLQVVDEIVGFNSVRTMIRKNVYGAPIPGQFANTWEGDKTLATDWIEVMNPATDGEVYIVAHAVMSWCGYLCDALNEAGVLCDWCLDE